MSGINVEMVIYSSETAYTLPATEVWMDVIQCVPSQPERYVHERGTSAR